jgi:FixJ family two-component response regulator
MAAPRFRFRFHCAKRASDPAGIDTKVSVVATPPATHSSNNQELPISGNVLISVVDDDESVRESLPDLLRSFGYDANAFASAEAFLASGAVGTTTCLVLDIAMPGMSGPELYAEIVREHGAMPVVFITGNGNPSLCEQLLKQGAVACLSKPFDPHALVKAVQRTL